MTVVEPAFRAGTAQGTTAAPEVAALFEPFTVNGLMLPNRIAMAPMTRYMSPGGVPDAAVAGYYARRAEGGTGLIITEGTLVGDPACVAPAGVPRIHGEDALAGWAGVVDAVHAAGGTIVPQLWHVGIYREPGFVPEPPLTAVGPSGLDLAGEPFTEPMTDAQLAVAVDAYVRAAVDAQRIGFDGVELHAAHGFLIDQFLWPATNRRTDAYGGPPAARARFGAEVVAAIRRATGPDFPIILRFSQWKVTDFQARIAQDPDELADLLAPLTAAGVDAYHVSTRRFWLPAFDGSRLSLPAWTRRVTGRPVIAVGSVGLADSDFQEAFEGAATRPASLERAVAAVEAGEFDLLAVGRAVLSDPYWAAKIRDGRTDELRPFDPASLETLT
ncbi:NADH:flavin oxidoreductase [Dactylosporangium aurantiacum]|uniref:NADH:flavin oxidoreductase n=1 Tax=Dactylosporangium aurantiacum TaxID=35754 RepID=UPI000AB5F4A8|nr:NADH:flavin oxidoreductase [Dactylosporangium aurantiacum]MDG6106906.1 NADH:flavin oxidoreductase [Dactylosporangium aurantiacum]